VLDTFSVVLAQSGDLDKAQRMVERALEASPGNPTVRYHQAMILARKGEEVQARRLLQKLLDEGGNFFERAQAAALLNRL
jgi:Flp pilus assembly protein TadD